MSKWQKQVQHEHRGNKVTVDCVETHQKSGAELPLEESFLVGGLCGKVIPAFRKLDL